MTTAALLDALWTDYVADTPLAERVHHLLTTRGEQVHHERVALWTYSAPGIGIDALGGPFEDLGWRARERQRCDERYVRARCWHHPDPEIPKVVISELDVAELSPRAQEIIAVLVAQLPALFARRGLTGAGRPWQLAHADYVALHAESEHAAWVAAFGPRAHHFTVDVGALATFPDLVALDAFLIEHGFPIDGADRFDHSSTRAESIEVAFVDETARIPGGIYELALPDWRARGRREAVIELQQHVDVDADELHTHAVHRGPSHNRG